jgi:hypothetical protein
MKQPWIAAVMGALAAAPMMPQTIKVGTFHKPSVVVAFYRSPQWASVMQAKIAEQQEAKKANDTKRAEELEAWGQSHQELAHKQLMGEAPITNILEALTPAFPEVARKAQVAVIAPDLLYADRMVEQMDVTDLLLDWLKADERTRKIIRDVRNR